MQQFRRRHWKSRIYLRTMCRESLTTVIILILLVMSRSASAAQCEPIQIKMCKAMPYNMTRMPNLLHHSTQENAILAFEQFEQLINTSCSSVLLFFLCSMYAPICTIDFQQDPIPPCRAVCEQSKRGCLPIMLKYNVTWPESLECDQLPLYDKGVCISPEAIVNSPPKEAKPVPNKDCKCSKPPKVKRKLYLTKKYTYAIRASVVTIQKSSSAINSLIIQAQVQTILKKSSAIHIKEGKFVELWTDNTCMCPSLSKDKDYLFMGYEDRSLGKLVFTSGCVATSWNKRWERLIPKWEKRLQRGGGKSRGGGKRGRKRGRKNKGKSGENKNDKNKSERKKGKRRGKKDRKRKKSQDKSKAITATTNAVAQ